MSIKRSKNFFSLLLALFILVVLSAGLSGMDLLSGEPVPWANNAEGETFQYPLFQQFATYPAPYLEGLIALFLVSTLIYTLIMAFVLSKAVRPKNLLQFILVSGGGLASILILSRISLGSPSITTEASIDISTPPLQTFTRSPLGTPTPIFTWLVSILLICGVCFPIIRAMLKNNTTRENQEALLKGAEHAIESLINGHDFRNVILNCYIDMTNAIQKDQALSREGHLTVTEFKQQLIAQGYPATPVQTLTQLFEKVRYGSGSVDANDETQAMDSLNAIIKHCKENKVDHGTG